MSRPGQEPTAHRGVWVLGEHHAGRLQRVSVELMGLGRRLADELGVGLDVVLLGEGIDTLAREISGYGADRLLLGENPCLAEYQTEHYTNAMADLASAQRPEVILVGSTPMGRDLAPRLSTRLRTGLMADCIDFEVDTAIRTVSGIKPVPGSGLLASIVCPERRPQVLTVRQGVLKPPEPVAPRHCEVCRVKVEVRSQDARTHIVAALEDVKSGPGLEEAEIVVAAGQGVGCAENMALIQDLADALGAALAATRPVVDAGWLNESVQVGQSGRTVRPRLYIACGVHGAAFHTVGMQNSDVIVAINEDPDAPIFKIATIGIVGDLRELVPLLTARLREPRDSWEAT